MARKLTGNLAYQRSGLTGLRPVNLSVKRPVNRSARQSANDWSVLYFSGLRPANLPVKQPVNIFYLKRPAAGKLAGIEAGKAAGNLVITVAVDKLYKCFIPIR